MTLLPAWLAACLMALAWMFALSAFARSARALPRTKPRAGWLLLGILAASLALDSARTLVLANQDSLHAWPPKALLGVLTFIGLGLTHRAWKRILSTSAN